MKDFAYEENRVRSGMTDMSIALLPLLVFGAYIYGFRVITLSVISVVSCIVLDVIMRLILKPSDRRIRDIDLSSLVIGLTTALCIPPTAPLYIPLICSGVSIIFVKHLASRVSSIRLSPTVVAIAVMYLVFPGIMTSLCEDGTRLPALSLYAGDYERAIPTLELLVGGEFPLESLWAMLVGLREGMIGQGCAVLIIAAAIYLLCRRVIDLRMPLVTVATVAVLTDLFPKVPIITDIIAMKYAAYHLLAGGLLFFSVFLSGYPGSTPVTSTGKLVCGAIGGVIIFAVRYYVGTPIGEVVAILVINIIARPIDILLKRVPYGAKPTKKSEQKAE